MFNPEKKLLIQQQIKQTKKDLAEARRILRNLENDIVNPSVADITKLNYRNLVPEQKEKITKLEAQLEKLKQ